MCKLIHTIYYAIRLLLFRIKNNIFTLILRTKLHLNNVKSGKRIKAVNGIPGIHIHHKVLECMFGNNVTLRSYMDVCWCSKTDIIVRKGAVL